MTEQPSRPPAPLSPKSCDDLADRLAERLLAVRRERRRRFWRQLAYLLMLVGAVSGLVTLLVMLWERVF